MVETILITLLIVAISLVLLGVKVFFTKGGKFPNGHVSGNKALRKKGIGCAQSQDCLLYTSPSPRDPKTSRMPSSA